jgi:phage shock protein A
VTLQRLLGRLLAPAPDPRPAYRRAESVEAALLRDLGDAFEAVAAGRNRLAALRERLLSVAGNDRKIVAAELELLEAQLRSAERQAERLAVVEQRLVARVESVSVQGRVLEARESVAAIHVRVGEALAGISSEIDDFAPDLARAEERAAELEARAAAIDQLLDL